MNSSHSADYERPQQTLQTLQSLFAARGADLTGTILTCITFYASQNSQHDFGIQLGFVKLMPNICREMWLRVSWGMTAQKVTLQPDFLGVNLKLCM